MWTQIVGKTRMALTPLDNHWWNVPLYVTPRGLSTSAIPYEERSFEIEFDFIDHVLAIRTGEGRTTALRLEPKSVAAFYAEYMDSLTSLEIELSIDTRPQEFPDPIPFEKDETHASYDKDAVERFWRVLVNLDTLFKQYRSPFIGKSSPVHFFWGSFDLALTRFCGRSAPERKGADAVTGEAYSHEVISCGFWPGGPNFPHPALYAYSSPTPPGLGDQAVQPAAAFYSSEMGEFFLKYEDVRAAPSPEEAVLDFCQSTYEAAAALLKWDRPALEKQLTKQTT